MNVFFFSNQGNSKGSTGKKGSNVMGRISPPFLDTHCHEISRLSAASKGDQKDDYSSEVRLIALKKYVYCTG